LYLYNYSICKLNLVCKYSIYQISNPLVYTLIMYSSLLIVIKYVDDFFQQAGFERNEDDTSHRQAEGWMSWTSCHRQAEGGMRRTSSHRQAEDGMNRTSSYRQAWDGMRRTFSHR
jgi:hypothetical protein